MVFFFNEDESSSEEREVMLCTGRRAEKAPDGAGGGKGRGWPEGCGQPGSLLR